MLGDVSSWEQELLAALSVAVDASDKASLHSQIGSELQNRCDYDGAMEHFGQALQHYDDSG